ncbi:MAG TPA: hypothetical protein VMT29_05805 [Steroidobacteraceae bacterium]|nr:hypothetical protein [Steroidobacteraceae bacterium]
MGLMHGMIDLSLDIAFRVQCSAANAPGTLWRHAEVTGLEVHISRD